MCFNALVLTGFNALVDLFEIKDFMFLYLVSLYFIRYIYFLMFKVRGQSFLTPDTRLEQILRGTKILAEKLMGIKM